MGKLCCCGEANGRDEVFSEAAESPHPAAAADSREQRSSSAPPARSQVIIAQQRLHKSSSFTDRAASPGGGGGVRRSASSLRYTPQHGIQRDSTTRSDRTKLKVAIAVVNTSNRLARGRMTEDKVDRRHSIWVLAEGTRLAEDSAARTQHLECVAARQSSRDLTSSSSSRPLAVSHSK